MGNRIKKDSQVIIAKAKLKTQAFDREETFATYKDEWGTWVMTDSYGHHWSLLVSQIRNDDLLTILEQHSYSEIIYWLMERNSDYQTVMWDMLIDAIKTTIRETTIGSLEDMYKYISENLI